MKTDLVGIYHQGQHHQSEDPAFFLTREEARLIKKLDQGFFVNHGMSMVLLDSLEMDRSAKEFGAPRMFRPEIFSTDSLIGRVEMYSAEAAIPLEIA